MVHTRLSALLVLSCWAMEAAVAQVANGFPGATEAVADARWLSNALLRDHPRLQLHEERRRFEELSASIISELGSLAPAERVFSLVRLVASLDDGHTGIAFANDPRIGFRQYPLELAVFSDGVFVTRATAAGARLLGKRITSIGTVPLDTVLQRVRPYLFGDNAMSRQRGIPGRLVLHELLVRIGAADGSGVTYVAADQAGSVDSVRLAVPTAREPMTLTARDATPLPLYLRNEARPYWFTSLPGGVLYAQINSLTRGTRGEFAAFCDSLFRAVDATSSSHLVLDLRLNGGGDGTLARPLLQRVTRSPALDRPDGLFVIVGRATFSAAVILAAAFESETKAVFVGEPTGAPANHYGEPARVELPATKLRVSYSTLFWQNGDPRDARPWIAPSLPAPLSFSDWKAQRDPAMEMIFARLGVTEAGPSRPLPLLQVGGDYPTRVAMLSDSCGGMEVASMPTAIIHRSGDSTLAVVHAGNRMTGVVSPSGRFRTSPSLVTQGAVSFSVTVSGQFSQTGFQATTTVEVRDPARPAMCRFVAGWIGRKSGAEPNVIPRPATAQ